MTLILNRRHFMGASALTAGLAGAPAFANMPLTPKVAPWSPVTAALQGFVDKKYVPGAAGAAPHSTTRPDMREIQSLCISRSARTRASNARRSICPLGVSIGA